MKTVATVLLTGLLAACATEPLPIAESRALPPEAIVAPPLRSAQTAMLIVARDGGFSPGPVWRVVILLNDKPIGALGAREHMQVAIDAGQHELTANVDSPFKQNSPIDLTVIAQPGEMLLYRVGFDANGSLAFARDRRTKATN